MWWEGTTERDNVLLRDTKQLDAWFTEQRVEKKKRPVAWGVGSVWIPSEQALFPFVLLNRAYFIRDREDWALSGEVPTFDAKLQPRLLRETRNLGGLPKTALPLYGAAVYRPVAANVVTSAEAFVRDQIPVRNLVICGRTGKAGSAALRVQSASDGRLNLLTVGHTFPDGIGSEVLQRRWWWLGRRSPTRPLGRIKHHIVPEPGSAGWDVAIIEPGLPLFPRFERVARCFRRGPTHENVFAAGGISGVVRGATVLKAALTSHGNERMMWRNCWMVAPGGVLRPGDSGSAVFVTADRSFLGLYVGASRTGDQTNVHYVQDGDSIRQHVLTTWGMNYY